MQVKAGGGGGDEAATQTGCRSCARMTQRTLLLLPTIDAASSGNSGRSEEGGVPRATRRHGTGAVASSVRDDRAGMSVGEWVEGYIADVVETASGPCTARRRSRPDGGRRRRRGVGAERAADRGRTRGRARRMTARSEPNAGSGDRARWRHSVLWCRHAWMATRAARVRSTS